MALRLLLQEAFLPALPRLLLPPSQGWAPHCSPRPGLPLSVPSGCISTPPCGLNLYLPLFPTAPKAASEKSWHFRLVFLSTGNCPRTAGASVSWSEKWAHHHSPLELPFWSPQGPCWQVRDPKAGRNLRLPGPLFSPLNEVPLCTPGGAGASLSTHPKGDADPGGARLSPRAPGRCAAAATPSHSRASRRAIAGSERPRQGGREWSGALARSRRALADLVATGRACVYVCAGGD